VNYYERHIGDYLKDTAHLSLLEHGIYARLMDVYYTREEPLNKTGIARLIGCRTDEEVDATLAVLAEFFYEGEDGTYTQPRCEREIARFREKQAQAKRAAQASVASRQASAERPLNDRSTPVEPTLNVPIPIPSPIPKEEKPSPSAPRFDAFWNAYPRKVGKDAARRAFDKRRPDDELLDRMLKAIKIQSQSEGWRKDGGEFIPHPSTWLNEGRWQDEGVTLAAVPAPKQSTWLAEQAEHKRLVEADRIARLARKEQAA
jgi:uncharacterized protein YdaU (DUF1376 family)